MKKNIDYKLFFAVVVLILFGMIMISSVSVFSSFKLTDGWVSDWKISESYNYFYVLRNIIHVIVWFIVLAFMTKINYNFFKKNANYFFTFIIFLLFIVLIKWIAIKWASSWIKIPWIPFTIQPTEFLKIFLIIFLAAFFQKYSWYLKNLKKWYLPFLSIIWFFVILVWLQPDFWTILIIVPVSMIMYFYAWMNPKHLLTTILLGFLLILIVYSLWKYDKTSEKTIKDTRTKLSYITDRIDDFLDDNKEAIEKKTINYQTEQWLIAVWSWWFMWKWFWKSIQKFGWLPEVQWDFIFAVIVEELWFFWWFWILFIYMFIWYRWFYIANNVKDSFAKYTAAWISSRILFQAFINIWVVLNIIPLTWITLPFVSYWGSSLLSLMIWLWILLSISRNVEEKTNYSRLERKKILF